MTTDINWRWCEFQTTPKSASQSDSYAPSGGISTSMVVRECALSPDADIEISDARAGFAYGGAA